MFPYDFESKPSDWRSKLRTQLRGGGMTTGCSTQHISPSSVSRDLICLTVRCTQRGDECRRTERTGHTLTL